MINIGTYQRNNLTRAHKESIFLLSFGTFLEYFDLMLYVHMAILLNELFFPQENQLVAQSLAAFTFCSTFIFRPVGGLVIGWIGDHIGRKNTIIITTLLMACCCLTMANIKTYAEIGVTATIVVIACRMLQGFSSFGEAVGASLYLTETLKAPHRYVGNGMIEISARAGGLFALLIASFALSGLLNWRAAFWIGAGIAFVSLFTRVRLRETPEFVDFQRRMQIKKEMLSDIDRSYTIETSPEISNEKIDKKVVFAYFIMHVAGSACFYIAYIYMGSFMKESLGMTTEQVINQNLKVSLFTLFCTVITTAFFVKKYHPLKIVKIQLILFGIFLPFIPYWFGHVSSIFSLSCLQFVIFALVLNPFCADIPCYKYLPVARRFTVLATTFGVATALANIIITFSLIPLTKYLGYYGLLVILAPIFMGLLYGVSYVEKLEKQKGRYFNYPNEDDFENPDTGLEENDNYDFVDEERYKAYSLSCEYAQPLLNNVRNKSQAEGSRINIKLIEKAILFAKKWHDGILRDTGEPFYSHPLAVADIVAEYYLKTDVIVAAILHDIVEDSDCTVELVEAEFNPRIAQMVGRLTKIKYENGVKVKLTLQETIDSLHSANDNETLLIKHIDRLHNLHTIHGKPHNKQVKTAVETNNHLLATVSCVIDKLNINNIFSLESKLFKYCRDVLVKQT